MKRRSGTLSCVFLVSLLVLAACAQAPSAPAAPTSKPASAPAAPTAPPASALVVPTATSAPAPAATAVPVAKPAKIDRIRVAWTAVSGAMVPAYVAIEKNLFAKHGLDAEVSYIATSTQLTPAVMNGEVPIAFMGGAGIQADLAGADIVYIAGGTDELVFSLYTKAEIKSVADLRGKKIGVSRFGSATDFGARYTLKKNNLEPAKDVAVIQAGGVPEILAALQAGGIDGGILSPPITLRARNLGFKELVDLAALGAPYVQMSIGASKAWVDKNPDIVRKFLRAYVEAISVVKNEKEFTKKALSKYTKTENEADLEETYTAFAKVFKKVPYPSKDAVQAIIDLEVESNSKAKDAKAETMIDGRFVKELDQSGFINSLYK
ncbi:MAG: ABC transporter substrate-binding protein [Chloroflexi bacterium]|nr:ABC transporter substrate-binding protein [Chloroflexota bacterium]